MFVELNVKKTDYSLFSPSYELTRFCFRSCWQLQAGFVSIRQRDADHVNCMIVISLPRTLARMFHGEPASNYFQERSGWCALLKFSRHIYSLESVDLY